MQSGTKLVLGVASLAIALGCVAWWYRFDSAHRATEFWGPKAAQLIVESEQIEMLTLGDRLESEAEPSQNSLAGQSIVSREDVSQVRGMVHLRHALTSDSNYVWNSAAAESINWAWALRYAEADRETYILLDRDFETAGSYAGPGSPVKPISCQPMAETLEAYFSSVLKALEADSAE